MFHRAVEVTFREGTVLEVLFQDGAVKQYDLRALFEKYPQLRALEDRELFRSGKLMGPYGIIWNEELDLETETIYQDGITIRREALPSDQTAARAVAHARAQAGLSQRQLAELTGIDQSDISKIERGVANPSLSTLERIASALGGTLTVSIRMPESA